MKNKKEEIIEILSYDLFPWINDGISKIQKKHGMVKGDVSPELDMKFREAYDMLAECAYLQLVENKIIKEEN